MKSTLLIMMCVCLLVAACQKRKYPDDNVKLEEENVYFKGYIGNEPISLKIGTDGYYCYSSYQQRPDSVYVFEGELKKFDCNPCSLALKFELSDYRKRLPGTAVNVDSSFRTGSRHFIPGVSKINTITFASYSNKEISSLRWNLSNGDSFQDSILSYEFTQPGPQTVSLTVKTVENCESIVVNRIFIGGETGFFACGIEAQPSPNNITQFKSNIVGGKPPYRYFWSFGDGKMSSLPAPNHSYQWSGSYPVNLRIEDDENNVCESSYNYVAGNDNSSCAANISLTHSGSRNAFLNGVKIKWTDQPNTVLRSDNVTQPAESYFEIINSQAYAPNEKGEPGRLLTVRFNVLLSDGNRKLWFKSENTAIVVTYK